MDKVETAIAGVDQTAILKQRGDPPIGTCPLSWMSHVDVIVEFPCGHWADDKCFQVWQRHLGEDELCPSCAKPFDEISVVDVSGAVRDMLRKNPSACEGYTFAMLQHRRDNAWLDLHDLLQIARTPPQEDAEVEAGADLSAETPRSRRPSSSVMDGLKARVTFKEHQVDEEGVVSVVTVGDGTSPTKFSGSFARPEPAHRQSILKPPTEVFPEGSLEASAKGDGKQVVVYKGVSRAQACCCGAFGGSIVLVASITFWIYLKFVYIPWLDREYPQKIYT